MTRPGFEFAARLDELPEGSLLGVVTASGRRICLANCGGTVSALRDECTHQEFPLSAGSVEPDGTVLCVWHGAQFDCRTGAVRHPPAYAPVPVYEVHVADGEIHVGPERRP